MSLLETGILAKYTCFFCCTAQNCVILQHQILKQHSKKLKRCGIIKLMSKDVSNK